MASASPTYSIDQAFDLCAARARAHYENFPVGLFVPKHKRRYVHALYAFARAADDFADEPAYEGFRMEKLDEWEARLHAAYEGRAEDPIFVALRETVERMSIPKRLLLDLLSAFRQDVVKRRYETFNELLDYCRRSADPIGRLVLLIFDERDERLATLSDRICTGLQLANHWQDVAIDLRKDRIYMPREVLARHGVDETDLRPGAPFRAALAELVARTRSLFEDGRSLCDEVKPSLRFEMRLTWVGGTGILDRIEASRYDVFSRRPRYGIGAKALLAWRAWRWKEGRA